MDFRLGEKAEEVRREIRAFLAENFSEADRKAAAEDGGGHDTARRVQGAARRAAAVAKEAWDPARRWPSATRCAVAESTEAWAGPVCSNGGEGVRLPLRWAGADWR